MARNFWRKTFSAVAITSLVMTNIAPVSAAPAPLPPLTARADFAVKATADSAPATYIVLLKSAPVALYDGSRAGFAPTSPQVLGTGHVDLYSNAVTAYRAVLASERADLLAVIARDIVGDDVKVLESYDMAVNGFAATLTPAQAAQVAKLPGVLLVEREQIYQLDTDYGPAWIGAPSIWDGSATGTPSRGEGAVVAIFDTGINSDHPSFADIAGDGYDHTNPLGSGNYIGWCNSGYPVTMTCNDKLIGMWGHAASGNNPEDEDGHGSHTASTVAGNPTTATVMAPTTGITVPVSGVAPRANIIAYDVCGTSGCPGTSLLFAVNQVITDDAVLAASGGIDVINYSISGGNNPYNDAISLGFLSAANVGILTSASAGNAGPGPSTNGHSEPWAMTVAASTHNRVYANALINLTGTVGTPPANMPGKGFTGGYGPAQIVYAGNYTSTISNDALCLNAFPPSTFPAGAIVVCDRGTNARVQKAINVQAGGAGGYILANDAANGNALVGDAYVIPGVHISFNDGVALKAWLAGGGIYTGTITGQTLDTNPANGDVMAGFSSRGPSLSLPDVIKPDLTAPGVDILAAVENGGAMVAPEFDFLSGTSMSAPHAAGAAALLRSLYPTWTPAQIKSALMLSTVPTGIRKEDGTTPSDPFDRGAGRIRLANAANVGFVLNETTANFNAANPTTGGDIAKLNLASLAEDTCIGTCVWTRTVQSVWNVPVTYTASYTGPANLSATVNPAVFTLNPGQARVITITANVSAITSTTTWNFGRIDFAPATAPTTLPAAVVTYTSAPNVAIPDNSAAGVTDTINIPDSFTVLDINLVLSATHTWLGDLIFTMTSPASTVVVPFDRPGYTGSGFGCSGDNLPGIILDDEATTPGTPVETSCANANPGYTPGGAYTPNNPLSAFDGESATGTWMLNVSDKALGDTGVLQQWQLVVVTETTTITPTPPAAMQMPLAVKRSNGSVPSPVNITALNNTGSVTVTGLLAAEITALQTGEFGLTKASVRTEALLLDPTNGAPYNNDGGTFFVTVTVPAGTRRLVGEIVKSTSLDIDLFYGRDTNANGQPDASEELGNSATSAVLEYLSIADPIPGVYWFLVQNWDDSVSGQPDLTTLAYAVVSDAASTNLTVTGPIANPAATPFAVNVAWNEPSMTLVEYWYGGVDLGTDAGNPSNIGTIDINLVRTSLPDIEVTPSALNGTQGPNQTVTHTLTISNTGGQDLTWNIFEFAAPAAAPSRLAPVNTAPTSRAGSTPAVVAETTASPEAAPALGPVAATGVPTTYSPNAPTAVLYNNGPFVTAVGTGPGGSNGSVLQNAALGMLILGYGHSIAGGVRVADDFTIPGPNAWQINALTFFAYQTGATTPTSTINNLNLQIWNGQPGTSGAAVVFGDTSTNRLAASTWTGAYRYADNNVGTTRPIMSSTAAVSVTLNPGTYWLDWQTGGSLSSGPWAIPIAQTGVLTTGNGFQGNNTWTTSTPLTTTATGIDPLVGVRQGLPFIIEGIEVTPTAGCGSNISWVSVSPASGTTPGLSASSVNVTYDSTGLTPGVYTGTLCINSNDPLESQVLVPLTLTVEAPTIGFTKTVGTDPNICASTSTLTVTQGTTVYYCYEVTNMGGVTFTTHTLTDSVLGTLLNNFAYDLAPSASAFITQSTVITQNTTNVAYWTATDGVNTATVSASASVFAVTDQAIAVNPAAVASTQIPNTVVTQTLSISNVGTAGNLNWTLGGGNLTEDFDDINLLWANGWFSRNNSSLLGSASWFQGNPTVFPAHSGATNSYAGVNFNSGAGASNLSNWLLTPPLTLRNGAELTFWTRTIDVPEYADRLQVRLSTAGASTDVGTTDSSVGDFTTLLLDINPTLTTTGYPNTWTPFTATISGLSAPTTGRLAYRYFVTNGGPSGDNSDYIGVDTLSYTNGCALPSWASVMPTSGSTAPGAASSVSVAYDSTGLTPGVYTGTLCINSNALNTSLVEVPLTLTVEAPAPSISLEKSVSTDMCTTTHNTLTVTVGTAMHYCFEVTNTGNVAFTNHVLSDTLLGLNLPITYTLNPGASVMVPVAHTASMSGVTPVTVVNTAEFSATDGTHNASATDSATLVILPRYIYLPIIKR